MPITTDFKQTMDNILNDEHSIEPGAARVLVRRFGEDVAVGTALQLMHDSKSQQGIKPTYAYLENNLGSAAFTALVMMYLETERRRSPGYPLQEVYQEVPEKATIWEDIFFKKHILNYTQ